MFFKNFYSWLRYTTYTPYTSFKNRLFIESLSSNSNIYSFLGETHKSFYWSNVSTSNLTNLWFRSSKFKFLFLFSILVISLLSSFFIFKEFNSLTFYYSLHLITYIIWRIFDTVYFSFIQVQYVSITYFFYTVFSVLNFTTKSNFKLNTFLDKCFAEHAFTFGSLNSLKLTPSLNQEVLFNYVKADLVLLSGVRDSYNVSFVDKQHPPLFCFNYVKSFYSLVNVLNFVNFNNTLPRFNNSDNYLIDYPLLKFISKRTSIAIPTTPLLSPSKLLKSYYRGGVLTYNLDTNFLGISTLSNPSLPLIDPKIFSPFTPLKLTEGVVSTRTLFNYQTNFLFKFTHSARFLRWISLSGNNSKFDNTFIRGFSKDLPVNSSIPFKTLPSTSTKASLNYLNYKSTVMGLLQTTEFLEKLRVSSLMTPKVNNYTVNTALSVLTTFTPFLNTHLTPRITNGISFKHSINTHGMSTDMSLIYCINSIRWFTNYTNSNAYPYKLCLNLKPRISSFMN